MIRNKKKIKMSITYKQFDIIGKIFEGKKIQKMKIVSSFEELKKTKNTIFIADKDYKEDTYINGKYEGYLKAHKGDAIASGYSNELYRIGDKEKLKTLYNISEEGIAIPKQKKYFLKIKTKEKITWLKKRKKNGKEIIEEQSIPKGEEYYLMTVNSKDLEKIVNNYGDLTKLFNKLNPMEVGALESTCNQEIKN